MDEHNMNCKGELSFPDTINIKGEVMPYREYNTENQEGKDGESD